MIKFRGNNEANKRALECCKVHESYQEMNFDLKSFHHISIAFYGTFKTQEDLFKEINNYQKLWNSLII